MSKQSRVMKFGDCSRLTTLDLCDNGLEEIGRGGGFLWLLVTDLEIGHPDFDR